MPKYKGQENSMERENSTTQILKEDLILLDEYRAKNNINTRREALHNIFLKAGVVRKAAP